MYSRSRVERRLVIAAEELGFQPELHSPGDIDTFNAGLERKYREIYDIAWSAYQTAEETSRAKVFQTLLYKHLCNPEGPRLNCDAVRFIQSERALCACDAAYFLTRHYWIKNRENNLQRFAFQLGQQVLFDVVAELEDLGSSIELMAPKSRQLGVTTEWVGMALQKIAFSFGVSGIMASAAQDKTEDMMAKLFMAYDLMSWWLRPAYTKRVTSAKGTFVFGSLRADFRFQHGNQLAGIGRGSTPVFYGLSECASYSSPEQLIEAALWKCVHPSPRVLGFLESTCEGKYGWWADTYRYAKKNWPRCRLKAVFLPFHLAPDMYPNDVWLRKNPVPAEWKRDSATRRMIAESETYIHSDSILRKVLGAKWTVPESVAWWWQCEYLEAKSRGQEKLFMQEWPHTDEVAFQSEYDNVFGREVISRVWSSRSTKYAVYGLSGQSIEERHEPDVNDLDSRFPAQLVSWENRRGKRFEWSFRPLLWEDGLTGVEDLRDFDQHQGKLFVWLPPERGYVYSAGVFTSNGISEMEGTCISVARLSPTPDEPDVQVAEFRSTKVSHVEAYAFAGAIIAYYAKYMEQTTRYRHPIITVEQVLRSGDMSQLQLMKSFGFSPSRMHHFTRYDSKDVAKSKRDSRKLGQYSYAWARPILIDTWVTLVMNGWYIVNSPFTLAECDGFEVHYTGTSGKSKFVRSEGSTEDGIYANALAGFCPRDLKALAERTKKRCGAGTRKAVLSMIPPPQGLVVQTTRRIGKLYT